MTYIRIVWYTSLHHRMLQLTAIVNICCQKPFVMINNYSRLRQRLVRKWRIRNAFEDCLEMMVQKLYHTETGLSNSLYILSLAAVLCGAFRMPCPRGCFTNICELAKIITKECNATNTFMLRKSGWSFVRVPKAWVLAYIQIFSLNYHKKCDRIEKRLRTELSLRF